MDAAQPQKPASFVSETADGFQPTTQANGDEISETLTQTDIVSQLMASVTDLWP